MRLAIEIYFGINLFLAGNSYANRESRLFVICVLLFGSVMFFGSLLILMLKDVDTFFQISSFFLLVFNQIEIDEATLKVLKDVQPGRNWFFRQLVKIAERKFNRNQNSKQI